MLDHITFSVTDILRAKAFYDAALKPLGYRVVYEVTPQQSGGAHFMGYGDDRKPYFWIAAGDGLNGRFHVAFVARDRAAVDAFYHAALTAGGKDNGPPGLRPHYHANYYGAFVFDPEGHNMEAVCHLPE
jgi:catechol 2,3-dioxygenase-like lactoylglutathione lyase family enzyme